MPFWALGFVLYEYSQYYIIDVDMSESIEKRRAREKAWKDAHPGYDRKWAEAHREQRIAYRKANRAHLSAYMREYQARPENRLKINARLKVHYAVKTGKLIKSSHCEHCGAGGPIEGDHSDYTKALEVTWLCRPCHHAIGRERRKTGLGSYLEN